MVLRKKVGGFFRGQISITDEFPTNIPFSSEIRRNIPFSSKVRRNIPCSSEIRQKYICHKFIINFRQISDELCIGVLKHNKNRLNICHGDSSASQCKLKPGLHLTGYINPYRIQPGQNDWFIEKDNLVNQNRETTNQHTATKSCPRQTRHSARNYF